MFLQGLERVRSAVARRARSRVRRIAAQVSGAQRPVILMYHRIAQETFDPWGLAVAPDRFADQLDWLAKHRSLLPLSEFAMLHRDGKLPTDAVAVTFDDAYACTATLAVPLLDRHGVPATIFLPAGLIGHTQRFWWDELAEIVMNHPGTSIHVRGRPVELGKRQDRDAVWPRDNRKRTPRQRSFHAVWAELQPLPLFEVDQSLKEMLAQYPAAIEDERQRLMTRDELRAIRSDKIEFGSHALTHTSLPSLTSAERAREIQDSVAACEELTGARPRTFAYPFGDVDPESEAFVAEAGFTCACTVEPRAVAPDDDPFALPRVKVGNWTSRQLREELASLSYGHAYA